jgi:hypothetical protein
MDLSRAWLDAATARRLAVKASVDPRSLIRVLRGEHVRGLAAYRAREVLEAEGLLTRSEFPERP